MAAMAAIEYPLNAGDAATRRAAAFTEITDRIYAPANVAKRQRIKLLNMLDCIKDSKYVAPADRVDRIGEDLFYRGLNQLFRTNLPASWDATLTRIKDEVSDEWTNNICAQAAFTWIGVTIKVCFLQTLTPREYETQLAKGRVPATPADLLNNNKLNFIKYAFRDSGNDPLEINPEIIEVLTAGGYIDPAGRNKITDPNTVFDTQTAYDIPDQVLERLGFGDALQGIRVEYVGNNIRITFRILGNDGVVLPLTEERNENHRHVGDTTDYFGGNGEKNRWLNNLANSANVEGAKKYILCKAFGDALQVFCAKFNTGATIDGIIADIIKKCAFTTDNVFKARCQELKEPVCVQEHSKKEYADLGKCVYYGPEMDITAARDLELRCVVREITDSNAKVIANLDILIAYLSIPDSDGTDLILGRRGTINIPPASIDAAIAFFVEVRQAVLDATRDMNAAAPAVVDIRSLFQYKVHLVNENHRILPLTSLFPVPRADPIRRSLFAIVQSFPKTVPPSNYYKRRRTQEGGGLQISDMFSIKYFATVRLLIHNIFLQNRAVYHALEHKFTDFIDYNTSYSDILFDIAYSFVDSTTAHFNYIGYSCLHEDTLNRLINIFLRNKLTFNMSLEEFSQMFFLLPAPRQLLADEARERMKGRQQVEEQERYERTPLGQNNDNMFDYIVSQLIPKALKAISKYSKPRPSRPFSSVRVTGGSRKLTKQKRAKKTRKHKRRG